MSHEGNSVTDLVFHRYRIVDLDPFWGERFRQPGMALATIAVIGSEECRWAIPLRLVLPDGRELSEDADIRLAVGRRPTGGFVVDLRVDGEPWPTGPTLSGVPESILLLDRIESR